MMRSTNWRPVLVTLGLLAGCRPSSDADCVRGNGLRAQAYDGSALPAFSLAWLVDGGPSAGTLTVGEIMAAHQVGGTFFVDGRLARGQGLVHWPCRTGGLRRSPTLPPSS